MAANGGRRCLDRKLLMPGRIAGFQNAVTFTAET
jgi:hypothetical protein